MATRPVFIPTPQTPRLIRELIVEFEWYPGFSKAQAQRSINSLHEAAKEKNKITPILDISSKSPDELGVKLSAFNLTLKTQDQTLSVECAYQGSKVFKNGGPYYDIYSKTSREAKKDERLKNSGFFKSYNFFGQDFPTKPTTAFYNWLYLKALSQNPDLANQLSQYQGFTDIAFNPNRAINCQARAAALFVALSERGDLQKVLEDQDYYLSLIDRKIKI
jgi:hypothetical protein